MTDNNRPIIAIDGGGTRTRLRMDWQGTITDVEAGPANVSTDADAALRSVLAGIDALAKRAGVADAELRRAVAHVGLAGVTSAGLAEHIRAGLPFALSNVTDDRPLALRGALGQGDGAVAHAGTGSFLGVQHGGGMRFAGGWGRVLGDEASAFWVVRRALSDGLSVADGLVGETALSRDLLAEFADAAGIIRFAQNSAPDDVAALAPRVVEAATGGDPMARKILHDGAAYLEHVLRRIGWQPDMPLVLTGGLGAHYAPYLSDDLRPALTAPKGTPIDGAMALARERAGSVM